MVVVRAHRRFGAVEALRGLDFVAPYGEVTGLVGPNGAGKTTLLLAMATLLQLDTGSVRIAGHDPQTNARAVRAVMGWVPDVFGVYDNLTSWEYLRFAGECQGLGRERAVVRATELLAVARLAEYRDQPVHVLSRGQKQRLGFVRALLHSPRVLLLDEPAAGLDPHSRVELRSLLRRLAGEGAAVVVSSHVLSDLEQMADRVVFVDHGVVIGERRMTELGPSIGVQKWRVRALDAAMLTTALTNYGLAHDVTPTGVELEVASEEEVAQLVRRLVADGVPVVASTPVTSSLEAAYLGLTRGEG